MQRPHLLSDWRRVLRFAWSVRLLALAALLTGIEAVLTVTGVEWVPILPPWAKALLLFAIVAGALVARIVAQRNLGDD